MSKRTRKILAWAAISPILLFLSLGLAAALIQSPIFGIACVVGGLALWGINTLIELEEEK